MAQLVDGSTVEETDIEWSLVRFRVFVDLYAAIPDVRIRNRWCRAVTSQKQHLYKNESLAEDLRVTPSNCQTASNIKVLSSET